MTAGSHSSVKTDEIKVQNEASEDSLHKAQIVSRTSTDHVVNGMADMFSPKLDSPHSSVAKEDSVQQEPSVSKETSEQDNYMELFVQKEIKDKFDPLQEQQKETTEGLEKANRLIDDLSARLKDLDDHYDGISRALLTKQGVKLSEISEYNILQAFTRLTQKEHELRESLRNTKAPNSNLSPLRPGGPKQDANNQYLAKLMENANYRRRNTFTQKLMETNINESLVPPRKPRIKGIAASLYSNSNVPSSDDD